MLKTERSLKMIQINQENCIGCGRCVKDCPFGCIALNDRKAKILIQPCMECGHCIAICPKNAVETNTYDPKEQIPFEEEAFQIPPENLLNFMKFRRSTRQFLKKEVEDEKLHLILEAGRYAPSAGNRQPLKYYVIKDQKQKFLDMAMDAFRAATSAGTEEEQINVFHGVKNYPSLWKRNIKKYDKEGIDKLFFHAPLVIVLGGAPQNTTDAAISATHMMLQAEALGVGSCFIGFYKMACELNPDICKAMHMSENEQPLITLVLGYSAVQYKRTAIKKDLSITML